MRVNNELAGDAEETCESDRRGKHWQSVLNINHFQLHASALFLSWRREWRWIRSLKKGGIRILPFRSRRRYGSSIPPPVGIYVDS